MKITIKFRSKIIIEAIKPFISPAKRILDVGCGNGVVSREIEKHFNCFLTGTDILDYRLEKINFKKMLFEDRLDFEDKSFDIGLFTDVLHHIPFATQIKLIQEALRVCSQVLIIEVKPTFTAKLIDYMVNQIHNKDMQIIYTFRNERQWQELFRKNGITSSYIKVKKPFFLYPISNYLFSLKSLWN
jgi:ubiquinone/menaquinone biosynthesis C-methylase UbiE